MPQIQIPLPLGSNPARSRVVSDQRIINGFIEASGEGGKVQAPIYGCAGLVAFSGGTSGICRGMFEADGTLYAVNGSRLQSVSSAGVVSDIGPIPGSDYVQFARNRAVPFQMVILSEGRVYVLTGGVLTRVLVEDVLDNVISVSWLNGYFIFARSDGQFYISAIDNITIDALDFASAEGDPDGLVRGVVQGRELFLMGAKTTEVWTDSGTADFPFVRLPGAVLNYGCGAKDSVANVAGVLYFVDNLGIVRRVTAGYRAERVSNYELERVIQELPDFSTLIGFSYTDKGHIYYVLTSPAFTWVYDQAIGAWHERKSGVLECWQANSAATFAGKVIVGSTQAAALYALSASVFEEAGLPLILTVQTPVAHQFPNGAVFHALHLDFETGIGQEGGFVPSEITVDNTYITVDDTRFTADQTHDFRGLLPSVPGAFPDRVPHVAVQWSDDGGATWSAIRTASLGAQGKRQTRVSLTRLGACGRNGRVFRISVAASVFRALLAAHVDVEKKQNG